MYDLFEIDIVMATEEYIDLLDSCTPADLYGQKVTERDKRIRRRRNMRYHKNNPAFGFIPYGFEYNPANRRARFARNKGLNASTTNPYRYDMMLLEKKVIKAIEKEKLKEYYSGNYLEVIVETRPAEDDHTDELIQEYAEILENEFIETRPAEDDHTDELIQEYPEVLENEFIDTIDEHELSLIKKKSEKDHKRYKRKHTKLAHKRAAKTKYRRSKEEFIDNVLFKYKLDQIRAKQQMTADDVA